MTFDIYNIRESLLARKKELEESLAKFSCKPPEKHAVTHYGEAHNYDCGPETADQACRKVLATELAEVEEALEIIDTNPKKYGICKYCGSKIPDERMKARPEATACVACLSKRKK